MKRVSFVFLVVFLMTALVMEGKIYRFDDVNRSLYFNDKNELVGMTDCIDVSDDVNVALYDFFGSQDIELVSKLPDGVKLDVAITDSVSPLLNSIKFNQNHPYNLKAPEYRGAQCPAGCVAIAVAQILAYHRFPNIPCSGDIEYETSTLKIPIKEKFTNWIPDWNNILPSYEGGNFTAAQAEAVADLCRKCALCVHMNYTPGASGANSENVIYALRNNFHFSTIDLIETMNPMMIDDWEKRLIEDLTNHLPVYYSSNESTNPSNGGHAYVCDGFKKRGSGRPLFHFNWGWGGKSNGWFQLTSLEISEVGDEFKDEGGSKVKYNFTSGQQAIFNIRPSTPASVPTILNDKDANATIFDILGNRVEQTIPGHIYIRNGKKFIAR